MGHVRIVCKLPPPPIVAPGGALPGAPIINGCLPDMTDTVVTVINDDGTEELLGGVTAVSWHADLSGPVRAYLTIEGAEIHADAPRVLCGTCDDAGWLPIRAADGTLVGATPCKRCSARLSDPSGVVFLAGS